MKFRDRTTGQIYSLYDLQVKFSNVSFPMLWDETTYDFADVDPVIETSPPDPSIYNRIDYVGVQYVDGSWRDVWQEVPKYDDQTQQAAWVIECLETQWGNVRGQRNFLLASCDYTQLPDAPITDQCKQNYRIYRQELRNITDQPDPYNINWPIEPEYISNQS